MSRKKLWDINKFNKINLPNSIGLIQDRKRFSHNYHPTRVLDMPIYMPGKGLRLPTYIVQFSEVIFKCLGEEESCNPNFYEDHYVYVTIDQKLVMRGNTGRRDGAHSDAYVEKNGQQVDALAETVSEMEYATNTYIAYDCLPTEFFAVPFPIENVDCEEVLNKFDFIANSATEDEIITYPNYTILKLNPYMVHRSAVSVRDQHRTFIKISISPKKYARTGNTRNENFDYNWKFQNRSEKRNHPWIEK